MNFPDQLLFFFSALGAFNGLLLALYLLFFLRPARLSNRLLGLLLLALSVRIGKSVFLFFNRETAPLFIQIGLTACIFIGPLLWAYLKVERDGIKKLPASWWIGFGVLAGFIVGYGLWRPYMLYPESWNWEFISVIYGIWALGVLGGGVVLWPLIRKKEWSTIDLWLVNVFAGNLIVHLAYRFSSYTSYIVGALSFSFVFYLLGLWFILQRRQAGFLVEDRPRYGDRKIDDHEAAALLARCNAAMEGQQLFLLANFKLDDLAQAAGSTAHQISQLLNDNLGQSFATYVRGYRVRHAQEKILTDDHLTLEAIGEEAGFGSKSAFYAAFKEVAGTTPARYRKEQ
ncbi:helix-turn-helix domain-containing protein [Neolewinella persica]|uniref:helix-turn-helix domain-containing protein n=1 Tax=Neolewinella persica TaxID=70998 RepID=UPI00036613B5|nr:helix-turn-helix domain-containing protein [Neolewinella persica]